MRLNAKLKAACLAGVAVVATLAVGEALAGGHGGWRGANAGGHAYVGNRPARGGHWVGGASLGAGLGQHWVGGPANRYSRHIGYNGGYGGGYYGGGGVYYDDAGYRDDYADDRPAGYSAATIYAPNYYPTQGYEHSYQVPAMVYAPVAAYRPYQHIIYLPATRHRTVRKRCNCSAD